MNWRATALALATTSSVLAGDTPWTYAQLVDAPLAPVERPKQVKILRLATHVESATERSVQANALPVSAMPEKAQQSFREAPAKISADVAIDPRAQSPLQTWRVFVGGEVMRPGAFNAQRPFTALQAVVAAGGLKEGGKSTEIVVLRYRDKDAPPSSKQIDLSASLSGKGASDLWLETHDVVIVPKRGSPASTDEILRGLPIPVSTAAKSRLVEVHRLNAEPAKASEIQRLVLPAR